MQSVTKAQWLEETTQTYLNGSSKDIRIFAQNSRWSKDGYLETAEASPATHKDYKEGHCASTDINSKSNFFEQIDNR